MKVVFFFERYSAKIFSVLVVRMTGCRHRTETACFANSFETDMHRRRSVVMSSAKIEKINSDGSLSIAIFSEFQSSQLCLYTH